MKRTYRARFHDALMVLPIGDIDKATPPFDRNPVFGAVCETLLQDCYPRGFHLVARRGVVLDLGENRGLFDLVPVKVLGADQVLSVEPESRFDDSLRIILAAKRC